MRVKDGKAVASEGPFVGSMGAVAAYFILETDSIDVAIELSGRILLRASGGAVEVRPAEPYW